MCIRFQAISQFNVWVLIRPFEMSSLETGQKQLANDKHVLETFALLLTRKWLSIRRSSESADNRHSDMVETNRNGR